MFEQICKVLNVNTEVEVDADILDFKYKKSLTVSIMKSIKLIMKWNDKANKYEGKYSNMKFETKGPEEIVI